LITRSQNVEHCRHSFAFVLRAMRAMEEPYAVARVRSQPTAACTLP
jgi:hypothetical protein